MNELLTLTNLIIVITVYTSYVCFNDPVKLDRLIFSPYMVKHSKEYYRFISSGLIHANWTHLLLNMFTFYSFGSFVEEIFAAVFGSLGAIFYLLLYFGAMVASETATYKFQQNNIYYRNLGASGAVAAVVFSFILFNPWQPLYLFFIPIGIPAIVLGVAYLGYSYYASQHRHDGIAHDVHFYGAIYGLVYTAVVNPSVLVVFWYQIRHMGQ